MLLLIVGAICAPAYFFSRRNGEETKWFLVAALPSIILWIGLTGSGYGAQSLSNLIEVIWLMIATVILSYLKVFIIDRKANKPKQSTYTMIALLAIGAFLLRTFMPVLPE